MTFNLWYRLSEELLKIDDSALSDLFKPYIQRLIAHLSVHCRLDEDTDPVSTHAGTYNMYVSTYEWGVKSVEQKAFYAKRKQAIVPQT